MEPSPRFVRPDRSEALMSADDRLDGPRGELLRLLERLRDRTGLTETGTRTLVDESEITYPGRRLPLLAYDQRTDHIRFVVQGVAKIVCEIARRGRITIDLVGKGEFLCLPPARAAGE